MWLKLGLDRPTHYSTKPLPSSPSTVQAFRRREASRSGSEIVRDESIADDSGAGWYRKADVKVAIASLERLSDRQRTALRPRGGAIGA